MKRKKETTPRPWLTADGVERSTFELKRISRDWDPKTWEDYLTWFESALGSRLIAPYIYEKIGDEQSESVFEKFDQNNDPRIREKCETLLSSIPANEAQVLRHIFFDGFTVRRIAGILKVSKTGVHHIKTRALSRLRREHDGDGWDTRQFMRGESEIPREFGQSIWTNPTTFKIREARIYDPNNRDLEFEKLPSSALRIALSELTPLARDVLYLRYWCDLSVVQIARRRKTSGYVIEQVSAAAVFRLKRLFIEIETGNTPGGGPSCA